MFGTFVLGWLDMFQALKVTKGGIVLGITWFQAAASCHGKDFSE